MCSTNIPDDYAYIVLYHVAEIFIILNVCSLQNPEVRVILSGAVAFYNFVPDGIHKGVEVLNLHGGKPIYINLNISQKLYKILVGGKFAQQTVVNPAAFQKRNHFITQMQFC